jgi:6-phosphogluconate dehydrogenase
VGEGRVQIGLVGLGRMGANMARRLVRAGHRCVVYDLDAQAVSRLSNDGATGAASLDQVVAQLALPRAVWVMVPAGSATDRAVRALGVLMSPDDVIVDGGNTYFRDDLRRAGELAEWGVRYVDVGTSGGVWGLERGYCLTIGGDDDAVERLRPIFEALAPVPAGYVHCGPVGAGHLVKMIHNGIEYGLMEAYAEGFAMLKNAGSKALPSEQRYQLPLARIAEAWRHGSVLSSWLLDLAAAVLERDPELRGFTGRVDDSGEGRWAVMTAIAEAVPAEAISAALYARFRSRDDHAFADKLLSALRHEFGGHVEPSASRS